jgi:transcriptional regulator with AAA-type ATPase domain
VGGFTPEALERLLAHTWLGNVRELENTIKQALLTCRGFLITAEDLRLEERPPSAEPPPPQRDPFDEGLEQLLLSHAGEVYRGVEDRSPPQNFRYVFGSLSRPYRPIVAPQHCRRCLFHIESLILLLYSPEGSSS